MARPKYATTIKIGGPFFENDPAKTFRQNVRVLMDAFVEEGAADLAAQLDAGQSRRAPISALGDRVVNHVRARTSNLEGRRWAATGVISVNNAGLTKTEGTSLMAAASEVEGQTKAFKRTTARLKRARAVNKAELLKGIA